MMRHISPLDSPVQWWVMGRPQCDAWLKILASDSIKTNKLRATQRLHITNTKRSLLELSFSRVCLKSVFMWVHIGGGLENIFLYQSLGTTGIGLNNVCLILKSFLSFFFFFFIIQAKRTLKAQKLQEELASGKLMDQAVSIHNLMFFHTHFVTMQKKIATQMTTVQQ